VSAAEKLFELQKVDITWDKVRRRLQQIQHLLGETDELKGARQRVAQTESELHQWRGKQKDGELESRSVANRIKATEDRLMSGQVHNPKELEALQASLEALRRLRVGIEDSAVDALMKADELAALLTDQQSSLAQVEHSWSTSQEELRQEEAKLKQNYVLLKRKRDSLAAALGPELLDRYEQMRKRKAGVAVAALQQDSMCGACHVRVPTGIASNVRSAGETLVLCPSCGRILFAV
jgi:predicted  nucleic acid-binding Zn-ribbon protein